MDGIAIRYSAFSAGTRSFTIQARQHAGEPQCELQDARSCIEIMTGAVLPAGSDCIIPVERITVSANKASVEPGYAAAHGQFIHARGSDYLQGREILSHGHPVAAADIAGIASCGLASVQVSRQPAISVISTGDELVPAGQPIADHQIRMSNGPAVVALLQQHGFSRCHRYHLADDRNVMTEKLAALLEQNDVLILSGGVSMGKADFVPEVLRGLGVDVVFHKISQRPGKPMWFGVGRDGQSVFALPGNPVSTLVCCRQYVIPALRKASLELPRAPLTAALAEDYAFSPALTCFLPVRVESSADGKLLASPVPTNTSGDFSALSGTDGYVQLDKDQQVFAQGSTHPYYPW